MLMVKYIWLAVRHLIYIYALNHRHHGNEVNYITSLKTSRGLLFGNKAINNMTFNVLYIIDDNFVLQLPPPLPICGLT